MFNKLFQQEYSVGNDDEQLKYVCRWLSSLADASGAAGAGADKINATKWRSTTTRWLK